MGKMTFLTVGDPMGGIISHSNNEPQEVSRRHSSEEVSVMEMEQRGEQSISLSMSRIAEMATSAVTNRVKDGQIKRDGKERTHGHKQSNGADII